MTSASPLESMRRHGAFLLAALVPLVILLFVAPIGQDQAYHDFADRRSMLGIPNFFDVVSSVPLLLVGAAGLWACLARRLTGDGPGWLTVFVGTALVGAGSAYYHWSPGDGTLVWDRLPLTLIYTGLFVAFVSEWVSPRLAVIVFVPIVLAGLSSVIYWHYWGDLRLYVWIQLLPVLTLLVAWLTYRARYTHQGYLGVALAFYVLARISEVYDREIFALTGNLVSGHTLKHMLAALAGCTVLAMLSTRTRIPAR